jgi:hypothetical protein
VNWIHALAMALLGGALVSVWRDPALHEPQAAASPFAEGPTAPPISPPVAYRAAELILATALAVVGGWYAVNGTVRAAATAHIFPAATLTVVILSPLVTLPMLNPSPADAPRGETGATVSTLVAVAMLNLCALLPLLAVVWHVKTAWAGPAPVVGPVQVTAATTQAAEHASLLTLLARGSPLPYPLPTWRVDAVVLTVLGFVLIPVSLGRWELRRAESMGLIFGYAVYLILVAFASVRL